MRADDGAGQRFEDVFVQVYEPLQAYLRRRTSRDDADEILDDVLTTIWRRLDDVPAEAVLPWSYGVARRALANRRRSVARHQRLLARLAAQSPPPPSFDPVGADEHPALSTAFAKLSEADREVLRLWAWEQLEPREIAAMLSTTPNAVSLRLSRAKRRLAADIQRQDRALAGHKGVSNTGRDAS